MGAKSLRTHSPVHTTYVLPPLPSVRKGSPPGHKAPPPEGSPQRPQSKMPAGGSNGAGFSAAPSNTASVLFHFHFHFIIQLPPFGKCPAGQQANTTHRIISPKNYAAPSDFTSLYYRDGRTAKFREGALYLRFFKSLL